MGWKIAGTRGRSLGQAAIVHQALPPSAQPAAKYRRNNQRSQHRDPNICKNSLYHDYRKNRVLDALFIYYRTHQRYQ